MARLTIGQKAARVLKLLMGLRHRRAAGAIIQHGFDQKQLEQGWKLLRAVVGDRLDVSAPPPADPRALEQIDLFENKWFPIASASLKHRFASVHERLFRNLSQTEGPEVVISVGTFLDRLESLDKTEDGRPDAEGEKARKLLVERGLQPRVIAAARGLLDEIGTIEESAPMDLEERARLEEQAENELWAWYLEWSTIARTAISDRRLLRSLGFLAVSGSKAGDEELEVEVDEEIPPLQ